MRRAFDSGLVFWLLRELDWWCSVSVLLDVLTRFPTAVANPAQRLGLVRPGFRDRLWRPYRKSGSAARARAALARPVLLKPRGAQAGQAMLLEDALPAAVFLLRQLPAPQRLFEADAAAAHGRDDRGLAAYYPACGVRWRQIVAHRRDFRWLPFERATHRVFARIVAVQNDRPCPMACRLRVWLRCAT